MSSSGNPQQTQRASQIHELGDHGPSPHRQSPSMPLNDTDAAKSILSSIPQKTIEEASKRFKRNFLPGDDDKMFEDHLDTALYFMDRLLSQAWDSKPKLKGRIRNKYEFNAYIKSDGKKQELVNLLKSMAKGEVPWRKLFENEAFLFPEQEMDLVGYQGFRLPGAAK